MRVYAWARVRVRVRAHRRTGGHTRVYAHGRAYERAMRAFRYEGGAGSHASGAYPHAKLALDIADGTCDNGYSQSID